MSLKDGTCDRKDCREPAVWRLSVVLFAGDDTDRRFPGRARTELIVCRGHGRLGVADVVSDAGWEQIQQGFIKAGRVPPRRASAQVLLEPYRFTRPRAVAEVVHDVVAEVDASPALGLPAGAPVRSLAVPPHRLRRLP